ncbi:MAG: PhoH family protein [Flavobacteriales bacterium]|nr:PhoH family protein [Flavobacteriales bacterium]
MAKKKEARKIFVLDTSVIIYDHNSIHHFAEHDVVIPITVLEELDNFKKGNDTKNFAAREFIRMVDQLASGTTLQHWIPLGGSGSGSFKVVMTAPIDSKAVDANRVFGEVKADHGILNSALEVQREYPDRKVILVSKDINLRLKAKSLSLQAEDYETGKIKDVNSIYKGESSIAGIDSAIINDLYQDGTCAPSRIGLKDPQNNHYYILKNGKKSALVHYNGETGLLERIEKTEAYGIRPLNAEQVFALHAILNPNVKLVTLQGVAGTGKTLLALAGALEQKRDYWQIYLARPIVPLSNRDIGFLPGDIKSKINPYMEPLWDNLKYIQSQFPDKGKEVKQIQQMVEQEKLLITPLAYIRGRSLSNIFFIIDEAQNLTPHEIKTIITRAGENTKIVFTGDIFQIDTPYLDTQSNGLSYLIEKVKGNPLCAHVTLQKGERSALANLANELL